MRNATGRQKARYWFDNLMSKGTVSLLLLLGVITAVVAVAGGLMAVALGGPEGTGADSTGQSIWFTLMHALNTGVLAKEEGTVPYLAVMTLVTFVGIFITSFLIGTISNGIKEKITLKRKRLLLQKLLTVYFTHLCTLLTQKVFLMNSVLM